jgi:ketosteroid isomerase-like protein
MSQENVEFVRQAIEALNRRDLRALAEISHEDLEWTSALAAVDTGGAAYRGSQTWPSYFSVMDQTWEAWRIEQPRILDAGGDCVAAVLRLVGTGRGSGVRVDREVGLTYRIKDGQMWRMQVYLDPREALEAVGLSHDPH